MSAELGLPEREIRRCAFESRNPMFRSRDQGIEVEVGIGERIAKLAKAVRYTGPSVVIEALRSSDRRVSFGSC